MNEKEPSYFTHIHVKAYQHIIPRCIRFTLINSIFFHRKWWGSDDFV
ncbi:MAG: hypothetical protein V1718_04455 [archaeon]